MELFGTQREWDAWLRKNHATATGIWVRIGKKNSGLVTIDHDQAVEIALCHGWIDAIRKKYDERTFVQRFTPRKPRSIWSQVNRDRAIALIEGGLMRPAGLAAVEQAKANGQWDRAYSPGSTITEPKDLMKALKANKKAHAFYKTLNAQNRFAVLHRLEKLAKPETRVKRLAEFMAMFERGERFYP